MRSRKAVLRAAEAARPYTATEPLGIEDIRLAPPGPGEVLVKIEAAGLCHSDLSVVNGDRVRPLPMALGHEAAGRIARVGEGVGDVRVDDHVVLVYVPACGECAFCAADQPAMCEAGAASNGTGELLRGGRRMRDPYGAEVHHHLGVSAFGEFAVVDRSSVVVIEDDVPYDVAALFGCALSTGFGAVTRTAGVRAGDSVAVIGLGGVGLAAVMAAHAMGAGPIVAVDPVEAKRRRAGELGATHAFAPDEMSGRIRDVLGGGANWVFEAVGSAPVMRQAFALTRRGGTTVAMGLPHPSAELTIPALPIIAESRTIKGSYMGSTRPAQDIPAMVRLWRDGRLPVERLISGHVPLEGLNEAMEALADGSAIRQIILPGAEGPIR